MGKWTAVHYIMDIAEELEVPRKVAGRGICGPGGWGEERFTALRAGRLHMEIGEGDVRPAVGGR